MFNSLTILFDSASFLTYSIQWWCTSLICSQIWYHGLGLLEQFYLSNKVKLSFASGTMLTCKRWNKHYIKIKTRIIHLYEWGISKHLVFWEELEMISKLNYMGLRYLHSRGFGFLLSRGIWYVLLWSSQPIHAIARLSHGFPLILTKQMYSEYNNLL